ncbi:MAG TPA: T9SS type A sorting domain-containing protein, partial [Ignavibacteriaceae bacterium]
EYGVRRWKKIVFVEGKGTTTEIQHYKFTDISLEAGKYSYRLKQIDFDGSFEYSNIVEVEVGIPNEFSLSQNYPNPFNPRTKIKYSIPNVIASETKQSQFVILKVYDLLGREVATLVDEFKPLGSYEIEFDASQLSSGIYYYRLKASDFFETKKMIVLK